MAGAGRPSRWALAHIFSYMLSEINFMMMYKPRTGHTGRTGRCMNHAQAGHIGRTVYAVYYMQYAYNIYAVYYMQYCIYYMQYAPAVSCMDYCCPFSPL